MAAKLVGASVLAGLVALRGAAGAEPLLGQLTHTIDVRHTNLMLSPDYLALRQVIFTTLRAFPEAARAVAAELHRMESDTAKTIEAASKPRKALPEPVPRQHENEALSEFRPRDIVIDVTPEPSALPPCPVPLPC